MDRRQDIHVHTYIHFHINCWVFLIALLHSPISWGDHVRLFRSSCYFLAAAAAAAFICFSLMISASLLMGFNETLLVNIHSYLCFLDSSEAPLLAPFSADDFARAWSFCFFAFFCLASSRWFPPDGSRRWNRAVNVISSPLTSHYWKPLRLCVVPSAKHKSCWTTHHRSLVTVATPTTAYLNNNHAHQSVRLILPVRSFRRVTVKPSSDIDAYWKAAL